jgi:hypothetical protein
MTVGCVPVCLPFVAKKLVVFEGRIMTVQTMCSMKAGRVVGKVAGEPCQVLIRL